MLAALERLSRRRALGGNTWIALVAFALIGIVTLQLGLLKLNAGIGRALEHEALLQRENAALSIENSELAASDRVSSRAVSLGMETIPTGALHFLAARPRIDPARSAAALSAPVHVSTTGSGEAPGGSSAVTSSSTPSTFAEPSATGPATSTSAESSTAGAATTQASGESPGRTSEEPAGTSRESTSSSTTPSPSTTSSPSAAAPTGAGSAEGAPAGGTRAGPSG